MPELILDAIIAPETAGAEVASPQSEACPIKPTTFNVVVKLDPTEKVTKGGIIVIESVKEREELANEEGTLCAVSPLAFTYARPEEWGDAPKPKVGDRVLIKRYQGILREYDGVKYRIINDQDIVAVIEGGE
jgi:co-chaperonin GroES (HSP10)